MQQYIFLDTETTGLEQEDRLVQVAWYTEEGGYVNELFKPPLPIKYSAMGVHHITNEELVEKSAFSESDTIKKLNELLRDHVIVAHNAEFDVGMLRKEGLIIDKYVCTKKLARRFLSGVEDNSLQTLRYQLKLDVGKDTVAHDAKGDVVALVALFNYIDNIAKEKFPNIEDREKEYLKSADAQIMDIMPFGKHKGKKLSEVPLDYLQWLNDQPGHKDADLKATLVHYLGGLKNT
ncbi:MAG: putative quorum-sensing-regulated virulence factor [Nitrospiria bacterium]